MEDPDGVGENTALYLYCIFGGPSSLTPRRGIDEVGLTFAVPHREVCALVSPVSLEEYGQEVMDRHLGDLAWLAPKVRRHEEIVRTAMPSRSVIPIRFGTIYASRARLLTVLRDAYRELRSSLDFVRGKEEWGLKVYASEEMGGEAGASSDRLRRLEERLASATPGEAHLLRKQRERLVREEGVRWREALSEELYRELAARPAESRRIQILSRRATGRADEMILNAAFLVADSELKAFRTGLDAIAARHANAELAFAVSGPWPPYTFCPDLTVDTMSETP